MADASEPQPDPEVDDEEQKTKTRRGKSKKGSFPKRYVVAIMIFLGICVQYALRVNLSVAIGAMCNNHTIEQNGFTIKKVGGGGGGRDGGSTPRFKRLTFYTAVSRNVMQLISIKAYATIPKSMMGCGSSSRVFSAMEGGSMNTCLRVK